MTSVSKEFDKLEIDEFGRIVLSEGVLRIIEENVEIVQAGSGTNWFNCGEGCGDYFNGNCTNATNCGESTNEHCSNAFSCGSSANTFCIGISPIEVGG